MLAGFKISSCCTVIQHRHGKKKEECRGKGAGSALLECAEQQAFENGFDKLSLIVFEQNEGAVRLYLRKGYREVACEPVVPHPLIHFEGDALLMVKTLHR